jgi:hypothetical protein
MVIVVVLGWWSTNSRRLSANHKASLCPSTMTAIALSSVAWPITSTPVTEGVVSPWTMPVDSAR